MLEFKVSTKILKKNFVNPNWKTFKAWKRQLNFRTTFKCLWSCGIWKACSLN